MSAPALLVALIEDAANRVLRMDADTLRRLGELDGKVVCLRYVDADMRIYVLPSEGGVRVLPEHQGEVDVTISGNFPAFARMLFGEVNAGAFSAADVQIRGDIELGQRFKRIMDAIDIDLEEQASRYVGDIAAHKLGNLARGLRQWRRYATSALARDATEYLQFESGILPERAEVEEFVHAVDTLRLDVERLAQRIERLRKNR